MKTMRIFLNHLPIAKKRHRHSWHRGRSITYDPQRADKMQTKWLIAKLFRAEGLLKPLQCPVVCWLHSSYPFPKSWSKKRVKSEIQSGSWKTSKPDVDNNVKFYQDVMNGIAYDDDAQIVELWATKRYSDIPGVEITIFEKGASMIHEHAITITKNFSTEEISYLIKKANQLGMSSRSITSVVEFEDSEGKHILFEVDELKEKGNDL